MLEWSETNGPRVLPPAQEGFGGKLIRNTIVYDLGGTVVIEYHAFGLCARFTIPKAHLVEPNALAVAVSAAMLLEAFSRFSATPRD